MILHISNIPYEVSSEDLYEYFQSRWEIVTARVIRSLDTGVSRGFGFVEFQTESGAEGALVEPISMRGRELKLDRARSQ